MSPETKPAKPIDIIDVTGLRQTQHPAMGDHWYWCRQHERAEHVGWTMLGCVRIGPFMTEREANRLGHDSDGDLRGPLGMEAER